MKIAIQVGRKDNIEKDFQMFSGTALVIRFSTKKIAEPNKLAIIFNYYM